MKKLIPTTVSFMFILAIMNSCQETEITKEKINLNSFSMTLNGNSWEPSIVDPCTKTFQCNMSALSENKFYNIEAYKDPLLEASYKSENYFALQVMNVNEVNTYVIDGDFGGFENYARLTINDLAGAKKYQNKKQDSSFQVEVTALFNTPNTGTTGIEGTFSGYLYNLENAEDSIKIENGKFTFRKTNWYNFNQCEQ